MRKNWPKPTGGDRLASKVPTGWKWCGAAAAASLAVALTPGAASARVAPATSPTQAYLSAVAARSVNDAWAVGGLNGNALFEHWNGKSWKEVANTAPSRTVLNAVTEVGPTHAWAAGFYYNTSNNKTPLVEQWNGTSWTQATLPSFPGEVQLNGISATSAADAWAAGNTEETGTSTPQPVILHWDGTSWTQATVPTMTNTRLTAVSATSATSAWAAGYQVTSSNQDLGVLLHWNGTSWSQVTVPTDIASINGISADSATDAWAAAWSTKANGYASLHYNGTSWTEVTIPNPRQLIYAYPDSVSAVSPASVWIAGAYSTTGSGSQPGKTLILHGTGTSWKQMSTASPSSFYNVLSGISAVSATNAWAVGNYGLLPAGSLTLILHWNGTKWVKVTSPN